MYPLGSKELETLPLVWRTETDGGFPTKRPRELHARPGCERAQGFILGYKEMTTPILYVTGSLTLSRIRERSCPPGNRL